jgi:hypothetical protein
MLSKKGDGFILRVLCRQHCKNKSVAIFPLREVAVQKQRALDESYERNPERFVRGHSIALIPPETVNQSYCGTRRGLSYP